MPHSISADSKSTAETHDGTAVESVPVPFERLTPAAVGLARMVTGTVMGGIGCAILATAFGLWFVIPHPFRLIPVAVCLGWWCLTTFTVVWWIRWEHERWSYRLTEKVFELRHGVLFQVDVAIPLSRLQHVDLHRGPLERRWQLASLEIHTAGTKDASHRIPALEIETANALRDRLIDVAHISGKAVTDG